VKVLAIAVSAVALAGGLTKPASVRAPHACVVPRLLALTPAAARARLGASGCRPGGLAYERPRAGSVRVTGQSPAAGAVLPRGTAVTLLVS